MNILNTSLSDLAKLCKDDNCNVITDKFDFTKKSDLDKLKEQVKTLKDDSNPIVKFIQQISGDDYNTVLDYIVDEAQKIYDNANTKPVEKPSAKVNPQINGQIAKLTTEYLNAVIIPNFKNITNEQIDSIYKSLYEFACWIYNK